jgi:hypothetical protein
MLVKLYHAMKTYGGVQVYLHPHSMGVWVGPVADIDAVE